MISIKQGTQTFSTAKQPEMQGNPQEQKISAEDRRKYFGDQELGDILNKVADPNWVDPAKVRRSVGSDKLDKDAFLKLLLAQLQHQDPTNPLKSHEMAAQLAQFSSLEQLSNINKGIESMAQSQSPDTNFDALKLIGKAVETDSGQIIRTEGDKGHEISFKLMKSATEAEVKIKALAGNELKTLKLGNLPEGKNEVYWNGVDEEGTVVRPGSYKVEIVAKASNGSKVHAETKIKGTISGVNFTPTGPLLMIGSQKVPLKDVKTITDPEPVVGRKESVNKIEVGDQNTKATKEASPLVPGGNIESLGLSRGMVNKLEKQGIDTKVN